MKTGDKFPNMSSTDLVSEKEVDIEEFVSKQRGNTLIVFWADYCGYCMDELDKLVGTNIPLITIGYGRAVKHIIDKKGYKFIVLQANSAILKKYGVMAFPWNFIVDKDMTVIKQY